MERKNNVSAREDVRNRREMRRYKIEILAIQETRWSGKGKIDKTNYTLITLGTKRQGKNGTAFLVGEYRGSQSKTSKQT
jgi:exonuclease III